MHVVLCLDDRNGMLFNARRLSSDAAVCRRVCENHSGRLWVNHYSAKLFSNMDVCVDDAFLQKAEQTDTCFVENLDFTEWLPRVLSITIYRWNRHYPSDVKLPQSLLEDFRLTQTKEFAGNSHEMITEEQYIR